MKSKLAIRGFCLTACYFIGLVLSLAEGKVENSIPGSVALYLSSMLLLAVVTVVALDTLDRPILFIRPLLCAGILFLSYTLGIYVAKKTIPHIQEGGDTLLLLLRPAVTLACLLALFSVLAHNKKKTEK
jgi:hypothetical protein